MSAGHRQPILLGFTVMALFSPRGCHRGPHVGPRKWGNQRIHGTVGLGGNECALIPSTVPTPTPVGPFHNTNLPPIKTGTMLLAYRRSINK